MRLASLGADLVFDWVWGGVGVGGGTWGVLEGWREGVGVWEVGVARRRREKWRGKGKGKGENEGKSVSVSVSEGKYEVSPPDSPKPKFESHKPIYKGNEEGLSPLKSPLIATKLDDVDDFQLDNEIEEEEEEEEKNNDRASSVGATVGSAGGSIQGDKYLLDEESASENENEAEAEDDNNNDDDEDEDVESVGGFSTTVHNNEDICQEYQSIDDNDDDDDDDREENPAPVISTSNTNLKNLNFPNRPRPVAEILTRVDPQADMGMVVGSPPPGFENFSTTCASVNSRQVDEDDDENETENEIEDEDDENENEIEIEDENEIRTSFNPLKPLNVPLRTRDVSELLSNREGG